MRALTAPRAPHTPGLTAALRGPRAPASFSRLRAAQPPPRRGLSPAHPRRASARLLPLCVLTSLPAFLASRPSASFPPCLARARPASLVRLRGFCPPVSVADFGGVMRALEASRVARLAVSGSPGLRTL